ncbi:Unknown protein sequence [Pseudomonas syringae pv. maculicola]|nr:Unknown protein sequence [Pseudomonas syringae pv. maculicola str. M6]KPB92247.1 Unknown protein sequence [Pseudomonas syringae pv. maculicola]KPC11072.1 Unknown protein sequence [Pseudomonas syringae pv. maculicola]
MRHVQEVPFDNRTIVPRSMPAANAKLFRPGKYPVLLSWHGVWLSD